MHGVFARLIIFSKENTLDSTINIVNTNHYNRKEIRLTYIYNFD